MSCTSDRTNRYPFTGSTQMAIVINAQQNLMVSLIFLNQQERPYVWKTKMVDTIVTYKDDPVTLAEGEWEYRNVSVEYKSYL